MSEYDATTALAVLKTKDRTIEGALNQAERIPLISAVRERGVDVHVVHGLKAFDIDGGTVEASYPWIKEGEHLAGITPLGSIALSEYGVIRTQLKILDPRLDKMVSLLNPTELRLLGRDKHRVAEDVLTPLDLYRQHYLHTGMLQTSDIDFAEKLVAKPNTGFASKGIISGSPAEIQAQLNDVEVPYLIEERLSFDPYLPVKGRDEKEQARLDEANAAGLNKEIRMYSFGDYQWHPVGRIAHKDELKMSGDEWVFLQEDSVPDEVFLLASKVKEKTDMVSSSTDTLLAVDMVYVTSTSRPEPHWEVMEVNAEHHVIRTDSDIKLGTTFRGLIADLIVRKAKEEK